MSDRPDVYQESDGSWSYRLSSFGGCIRNLVACRRGITPMPVKDETYFHEGHLHEADVIKQLTSQGYQISDLQEPVQLDVLDGHKIVGHLDAGSISVMGRAPKVLEIKALGKARFNEAKAMGIDEWFKHEPMYSWQVSGAMWAKMRKATVVVKSRDSGEVLIAEIDTPFKTMDEFTMRMEEIESWIDVDRFPPCEKTGFCWKGPFRHIHYKENEPKAPIPIHEVRNRAVEEIASKLYDTRMKKKAITQQEEDLKEELLGLAGEGVYLTDDHKVTIQTVKSKRMDSKAVREEHGGKYDIEIEYTNVRVDPKG